MAGLEATYFTASESLRLGCQKLQSEQVSPWAKRLELPTVDVAAAWMPTSHRREGRRRASGSVFCLPRLGSRRDLLRRDCTRSTKGDIRDVCCSRSYRDGCPPLWPWPGIRAASCGCTACDGLVRAYDGRYSKVESYLMSSLRRSRAGKVAESSGLHLMSMSCKT